MSLTSALLYRAPRTAPYSTPRTAAKPYTKTDDEEIISRRRTGESFKSIANFLGRSYSDVSHRWTGHLCAGDLRADMKYKRDSGKLFTPEEDAAIVRRRLEGATYRDIASELQKPIAAVEQRIQRVILGPGPIQNIRPLSDSEKAKIVRMREEDKMTLLAISKESGRSHSTVERVCHALQGVKRRMHQPYSAAEDAHVLELREKKGLPWHDIATLTGRSRLSVQHRYRRHLSDPFHDVGSNARGAATSQ